MSKKLDWYYDPRGSIVKADGTDAFSMYRLEDIRGLVLDFGAMSYLDFKGYVEKHKKESNWVTYGVL